MFRLSARATGPISPIRKIAAQLPLAAETRIKKSLPPLIDLSIGQPHFSGNPEVLKKLANMAIDISTQHYSPAQGTPATLQAIVDLYNHYYPKVTFKTNEVMVTVGANGALSNAFSILVQNPNDFILVFEPYFGAYVGQVQEWGGTLKAIPTIQNQFRPNAKLFEAMLFELSSTKKNVKALLLNFPCNPSGVVLTRDEMDELAKVLIKHPHVLIIIDDVYRDFVYSDKPVSLLDVAPQLKDRCIIINSGAKGLLGIPGERVGMVAAHESIIASMLPRQTNGNGSISYRTQAALRFAVECYLKNPNNDWQTFAKNEYKRNLILTKQLLAACGFTIPQNPEGAFYLLVDAKHLLGRKTLSGEVLKDDIALVNYFLNAAGVAVVPGSGFGIDKSAGCFRISCANERGILIEAVKRMDKAAKLLSQLTFEEVEAAHPIIKFGLWNEKRLQQQRPNDDLSHRLVAKL